MSGAEAHDFEVSPFFNEVMWLCRIHEEAKSSSVEVPGLEHYREPLEDALLSVEA